MNQLKTSAGSKVIQRRLRGKTLDLTQLGVIKQKKMKTLDEPSQDKTNESVTLKPKRQKTSAKIVTAKKEKNKDKKKVKTVGKPKAESLPVTP